MEGPLSPAVRACPARAGRLPRGRPGSRDLGSRGPHASASPGTGRSRPSAGLGARAPGTLGSASLPEMARSPYVRCGGGLAGLWRGLAWCPYRLSAAGRAARGARRGSVAASRASRVVMRHDGDGWVVVGARTRTIPPALRPALQHRDQTCRFPGCHVRVADGHHVRHWAQGGADQAVESRAPLLPPSSGGARGGLPGRARGRRGPQRSERRASRRGSSSMRARASPSGSGSGSTWAGRSTCCIRELGDPPDLRSRYRQACSTGLPGRRSSPTAMAMFNRFHRMPLTNAVW